MKKVRIINLRSLKDTKDIELKPLTVIVGKNSSGKSTFLRFFPLMKQTLETSTNEPILWYSSRYVDFGSFEDSVNLESRTKTIRFEFEFNTLRRKFHFNKYWNFGSRMVFENNRRLDLDELSKKDNTTCRLSIECSKEFINKIEIKFEDHNITLTLGKGKLNELKINEMVFENDYFTTESSRDFLSILPIVFVKHKDNLFHCEEYFKEMLFNKLKEMAHGGTRDDTIYNFIDSLIFGDSVFILRNLKTQQTTASSLIERLKLLSIEDPTFLEIKNYFIGMHVNNVLSICNEYLESYFASVRYIAPIRASAERYYRIQGLSVKEVDPRGENIPMLLQNMKDNKKRSFNNWLKENFGFEISIGTSGGHTSLKIKYANGDEINLADTGFGYSQVLPIIIVLWQTTQEPREQYFRRNVMKLTGFRDFFTIIIEQPELHLHPALQAKLIDTFVKVINMCHLKKIEIKIILETHSETIVNRIGYLIAKKYQGFNEDLVNVLIFDNSENPYDTRIETTSYSNEGYLTSWPLGFFSPEGV